MRKTREIEEREARQGLLFFAYIKRILLRGKEDTTLNNPGGRVAEMGDRGGKLFRKSCCYFSVAGERFGGKGDGLINRGFGTFPIKELNYAS